MVLGRLETTRERRLAIAVFVVVHPLLAWCGSGLISQPGVPAILLTSGAVVALLLSVGPVGAPVVAVMRVVSGVAVLDESLTIALVVEAVVEAVVLAVTSLLLEERFRQLGPLRRPRVVSEFVVVGALLGPVVLVMGVTAVRLVVGDDTTTLAAAAHEVVAHGLGILVVAPGLRMLAMREPVSVDGTEPAVMAGGLAGAVMLLTGAVLVDGAQRLVAAQVAVLPLLFIGLLAGTTAYGVATASLTIATTAAATALLEVDVEGDLVRHLSWWAIAAVGFLLAAEGDRRRQAMLKLTTLFGHSAAASAEVDSTGRVIQVNRAFAAMLGWRPEELVDSDLLMLFASDDDGVLIELLIAGTRDEVSGHARVRTRSGTTRRVRYSARRLVDAGPSDGVLLVQLLDLSAEERRAVDLERSNDALQRLGQRISHDLKQPLAAIAGYASTLKVQRDRLDEPTFNEMLDRLDLAARRAVDQLESMVQSARVGGDATEAVALSEVVSAVTGLVEIELREAGGTIETALEIDAVDTDPRALQQVLLNLVTNSLKYHDDVLPPRVLIGSRVRGGGVELTVCDNGPGIEHEHLEAVFEPGRRLDPSVASGRGMGLADSRRSVEELGGWLRAEPSAAGARFVLWLPDVAHRAAPTVVRVVAVDGIGSDDGFGGRPATGIPVDLHHERLDVVGRASSVSEAVAVVAAEKPDVVFVDDWRPDAEGMTAIASIATAHPLGRVVVRTNDGSVDARRAALAGGVTRAVEQHTDARGIAEAVLGVAG